MDTFDIEVELEKEIDLKSCYKISKVEDGMTYLYFDCDVDSERAIKKAIDDREIIFNEELLHYHHDKETDIYIAFPENGERHVITGERLEFIKKKEELARLQTKYNSSLKKTFYIKGVDQPPVLTDEDREILEHIKLLRKEVLDYFNKNSDYSKYEEIINHTEVSDYKWNAKIHVEEFCMCSLLETLEDVAIALCKIEEQEGDLSNVEVTKVEGGYWESVYEKVLDNWEEIREHMDSVKAKPKTLPPNTNCKKPDLEKVI